MVRNRFVRRATPDAKPELEGIRDLLLQPADQALEGDQVGAGPAGAVDDRIALDDAWQGQLQLVFEQRHDVAIAAA